jgi:hypothetical protein
MRIHQEEQSVRSRSRDDGRWERAVFFLSSCVRSGSVSERECLCQQPQIRVAANGPPAVCVAANESG